MSRIRSLLVGVVLLAPYAGGADEAAQVELRSAAAPQKMRVLLLPPRAGAVFRSVDGGVREWWNAELAATGVEVVPRAEADAAIASVAGPQRRTLHGADAPAAAQACGATHVFTTELRYARGEAEVWMRAYDGAQGGVIVAGRAEGKLAKLGDLLLEASAPLRKVLRLAGAPEAARLAELGSWERAADSLRAGRPADVLTLLSGSVGRVPDALRAELAAAAEDPQVSLAERSRLASVTGEHDPNWLQVRQGIIEGDDPELLLAGATNAEARGEHARALELAQQAAALAPESRQARIAVARGYSTLDRHAEARSAWEAVLALDPTNLEAREALARNPLLPPDARADQAIALGELRSERLDVDGAESSFERAARLAPARASKAKLGMARLHARTGNHDEALLAYEELGASGPEPLGTEAADVYAGLGAERRIAGDTSGAAQAYSTALTADPDHLSALQGQGELLLDAGMPGEAVVPLARALELDGTVAATRSALARAHRAAGDSEQAIAVLAAEAVPLEDRPRLLMEAAELQRTQGDLEAAKRSLQTAVELDPDAPPLRSALAKVYEESGDVEAAAREEAQVSALTTIAPTDAIAAGVSERQNARQKATEVVGTLVALIARFPTQRQDGRPFAGVSFVGLSRDSTYVEQVRAWLLPKRFDSGALEADLATALSQAFELTPPSAVSDLVRPAYERVRALSTDRGNLALVHDALGVEASFAAKLTTPEPIRLDSAMTPTLQLEMRMHTGLTSDDIEIFQATARVPGPERYMRWNPRPLLPLAALLALLIAPIVRGWGRLVVRLDYEAGKKAKGFFTIEISRRPGVAKHAKEKAGSSKVAQYQKRANSWSRFKRYMAERENVFRLIPARSYFVCVHGIMQNDQGEVVGNYLEERPVRIPRNGTLEVGFDFRAKEAPLEVRLSRPEGDGAGVARVVLRGVPSSLKFVKDDHAIFYVAPGQHTVLVGYGECAYEREIEVVDFSPQQVTISLGDPAQAIFEGVKEAVEPFLLGDLPLCARALDKAGMAQKAAELRAKYHEAKGDKAAAAKFYREAGKLAEAAELAAESGGGVESAEMYEEAGDHRRAATGYLEAGDFLKAAQSFEAVYDFNEAIDAYRRAGEQRKVLELLERTGRHHEGGVAALDLGDEDRAIRNFQQVDLRDPDYAESCRALAELFMQREEWVLAIDRLREAIHAVGEEAAPLELYEQLGGAFERSGDLSDALQTFDGIRKRDYQYPGIADRIRAVKERISALEAQPQTSTAQADTAAQSAGAAATAPGAASGEDRYEILGEVGRGGMGIVFKARDRRLGRVVALKRLPDNLRDHPTAVALFLREAQSAAALNHPNIVTVYDTDQTDGNYYLTMEFLEGMPLDAILRKRGKLSPRDALRMGVQIATGLQYAHERGIVHRDIKTANLFFTRDRVVKIMDFGLAKMVEEVRKAATVIGGTPYYMAPEQALGEGVDHRADLYAFGVTLFELLSGQVPFREGDITYHHRHTPPPPLSQMAPGCPAELAALVARLMAKRPEDRPSTTAEVTAALDSLLRGSA